MTRSVGACTIALLAGVLSYGSAFAGATASHFRIKGPTALANFHTVDPSDPCVESFVSTFASDLVQKVSPGEKETWDQAIIYATVVDVCTDFPLFVGEGETTDHLFQIANDLSSATLTATMQVFNTLTLQWHDFYVDLTWTATEPAVRERSHERFRDREAGIFINTHVRGLHAEAVATGTIFGEGVDDSTDLDREFAPGSSISAELMTQAAGSVVVEMSF